ncbi:MAG: GFA family protein [Gammaproteobacteria bacterium]|nr:GFA family protein [Gammaproteobacteria bacterium]MDH3508519.1 GFA family protein [Gammaproteobacteria bacterium]
MELPARGSCQCGNVTYHVTEEPLYTAVCHCLECQKLSASAFSVTMIMRRSGFELLSGELKRWERPTASGGIAVCWFCPDCGNRIYHENPAVPEIVRVKTGTLDDPSVLQPQVRGWMCRQQPWLEHYSELPVVERQIDFKKAMADIEQGKDPF